MTTFIFVLALLAPVAAFAGQGPLSPGYYICETMEGNTSYFSDIFLGPGDADAVSRSFSQMVGTKYGYTGRVTCPIAVKTLETLKRLQNQHKPYAAQRAQQGRKIVETGWTYNGAPSLSAATPQEPTGSELKPASGVYCYEVTSVNGTTIYYSKTKPFAANIDPNSFNIGFSDFIAKTYGERTSSQCFAANEIPDRNQYEAARQAMIDKLRRGSSTAKFVEVDWTPSGRVWTSGIPAATTQVPSAPKADAQSAYEKALEAQRPRSNAAPAPAAGARASSPAPAPSPAPVSTPAPARGNSAATSAAAAPQSGPLYSYCAVFAFPRRPGGSQHYYATPLFVSEPSDRPAEAFQLSIRNAHPEENVQSPFCTPPKPMDAAQPARLKDLDAKRHNKANAVVEVNWKPGTR